MSEEQLLYKKCMLTCYRSKVFKSGLKTTFKYKIIIFVTKTLEKSGRLSVYASVKCSKRFT